MVMVEKQRKDRLVGSLLHHVFGPDRVYGNKSRYASLTDAERIAIKPYVHHDVDETLLTESGDGERIRSGAAMHSYSSKLIQPLSINSIPTPTEVATRLEAIGGKAGTMRLKARMVDEGWRVSKIELGIQRAIDGGAIILERDWSLSLPE